MFGRSDFSEKIPKGERDVEQIGVPEYFVTSSGQEKNVSNVATENQEGFARAAEQGEHHARAEEKLKEEAAALKDSAKIAAGVGIVGFAGTVVSPVSALMGVAGVAAAAAEISRSNEVFDHGLREQAEKELAFDTARERVLSVEEVDMEAARREMDEALETKKWDEQFAREELTEDNMTEIRGKDFFKKMHTVEDRDEL